MKELMFIRFDSVYGDIGREHIMLEWFEIELKTIPSALDLHVSR